MPQVEKTVASGRLRVKFSGQSCKDTDTCPFPFDVSVIKLSDKEVSVSAANNSAGETRSTEEVSVLEEVTD